MTVLDDGTYVATIDRISEGIAVLLIEGENTAIEERQIDDLERIPEDGRHAGAVLHVKVADGHIIDIMYDPEGEQTRRAEMDERFDRLSDRPPSRDSES